MIWHLVLCILSQYSTQTRDAAYPGRILLPALCARLLLLLPGFSSLPVAYWAIFSSRQKKKGGKRNKGAFLFFRSGYRQQMYARQKKKKKKTENVKNCVQFKDIATRNRWCKTKVVTWMFLAPSVKVRQK